MIICGHKSWTNVFIRSLIIIAANEWLLVWTLKMVRPEDIWEPHPTEQLPRPQLLKTSVVYPIPLGSGRPPLVNPDHCYRSVKCRPLNTSQCLDVTLPYKYTAVAYEGGDGGGGGDVPALGWTADGIDDYLSRWKGLRSVPQCWKAMQSVLCATFVPRCDPETDRVSLPTHDMCRLLRHPCRLLEQYHHWPAFLRCDDERLFPQQCKNDYMDLKFLSAPGVAPAAKCSAPLVTTDDANIWYPGIEGCGVQCQSPVYSPEAHRRVASFVTNGAAVSLVATLLAVLTFIIDWHSSNRYPAVIIFYLCLCFMMESVGWLLQSVLHNGQREIVCRADNTSRYGEPGNSAENFYCLTTFLLIYYFSMAAMVWFVNLAYAWDLSFQATGATNRDAVNSKVAYFHLTAWSVPLMLTITILALGEVDGDSLRGICFVGVLKPVMRICFVLVPMTISVTIGCYYMFKSMLTLIKVKLINRTRSNSNRSKSKKIEHMIIRIGLYVLSSVIGLIVTYVSHIYELTHSSQWKTSLNDYIICTLNMTAALGQPMGYQSTEGVGGTTLAETDSAVASVGVGGGGDGVQLCKLMDRPNLTYVYLQLTVIFGAAVCTSSWVWTGNSLRGWRRFMKRHLKPDHTYPIRIKPHETIAKTYGRRNQLSQGCYSPSFQSMHSDPVAMNLNSAVSQDLSATFAGALPNLMYRRGAVAGDRSTDAATIAGQNHYLPNFVGTRHSSNSDVSQQQSYDSYRRSLDSQYSIEMVAMDRHKHRKTRKEREKLLKPKGNPHHHRRRGSDTSGSVISTALAVRAFQKAAKSECKSTSTRDLMQLPLSPLPHTLLPQLTPQLIANPFMTPPICSPAGFAMPVPSAQSSHSTLSFMPPTIPPFIRPKVKPNPNASTSFTFTHGMSDQSSHLINPLLEKRRPDSCLPPGGHPLPSNSSLTVQQSLNTTPNGSVQPVGNNLGLQYAPSANYGMPFMANNGMPFMAPNPQSLNYYTQPMNAAFGYGNLLVNSQTGQSFPNYTPFGPSPLPQPGLPFPAYPAFPPYPSAAQPLPPQQPQQCANIQDVQELMRQREAFLSICLPHRRSDTASEPDANYLNIVLSDSEGIYSPDPGSRNEGLITAQQLVDEHIQRVEAAAEANTSSAAAPVAGNSGHNETIVGALGGQGLDMESNGLMEPKASKSESKRRNKKKAAKKHKNSNGTAGATAAVHNSANNSNNNNNANDVKDNECDEQNPLMGGADTAGADDEPNH